MSYSPVKNKRDTCYFSYKIPIAVKVENYPNIMLNSQIFPQLLALMWEATQLVLATKFPVVLELRDIKLEVNCHHEIDGFEITRKGPSGPC